MKYREDGKYRKKYRIFSAFLCFCMLFTLPGISDVSPVAAAEQESGADTLVQTLLDRIAALPEVEEYLSEEPDVEEEAYAEWEEKLYEYAEEALAIWEEYEALTEKQQAQIAEMELEKLTAWVELAEQLAETDRVMLADDSEHHNESDWTAFSVDNTSTTELSGGKYYLANDVTMGTITITEDVTLCLNGHTLTHSGDEGSVIEVQGGTFTLCDCSGDDSGCITNGKGTKSGSSLYGGGVYVAAGATFNMCGGSIKENNADIGGGVAFHGTEGNPVIFNFERGEISGNEASSNGGGVWCGYSEITMEGGSISGNVCSNFGGGIFLASQFRSTITIRGGSITGNNANGSAPSSGGGIFAYLTNTIILDGNVNISDNSDKNGENEDIFLMGATSVFPDGIKITITENFSTVQPISIKTYKVPGAANNYDFNKPYITVAQGGSGYEPVAKDISCFKSFSGYDVFLMPDVNTANKVIVVGTPTEVGNLKGIAISVKDDSSGKEVDLEPEFDEKIYEYEVTVPSSVKAVSINAEPKNENADVSVDMTIRNANNTTDTSVEADNIPLATGENTIHIAVTEDGITKVYKVVITREEPSMYNVTLHTNGGSGGTELTSYTEGTDATLPQDWTKQGYAFAGWYDNEGCTGTAVTEIAATATGDKEYWAKWNPVSYTITYILDGGTVTGNPAGYTIESDAITLKNPTKAGYTFAGWSGTDLTGSNNTSVTIAKGSTGNRTYTAHWTVADYTVTLHTNGGSGGTGLASYTYGTGATLPTDWKKMGYTFAGWYDNEGCTGTAITEIAATATGDKEYWAKWNSVSYTITYILDGGMVTGNPAGYTIESDAITLKNPTKAGYTFAGWSGTDLTGSNNTSVTIAKGSTGNRTYTAHWTAAGYTVTLHTNGGSGGTGLTSYTYGTGATLPTDWTKQGYIFAGWYDNENCTGNTVTNISNTATGNKEYWAKWTDNTAPVIGTLTYSYQPKNLWQWLIGREDLVITVPVTEEGSGADQITYTVTPEGGTAGQKTSAITNGEAKITVPADFKGTITIVCTDKDGNTSSSVTVGAGLNATGIIIEDNAPQITSKPENAGLLQSGEYEKAPSIAVTVTDNGDNAISGGIASVTYQVGNGSTKTVDHDYTTNMVFSDSFSIPAGEIPAGETVITITATDHAGNSTTVTPTVKVHTHSGTLQRAVEPTCTDDGNTAYYTCTCGKWFSDNACTDEITDHTTVIVSMKGHDFENSEYQFDETQHWQQCSRCTVTTEKEAHIFENDSISCSKCDFEKAGEGHIHSGTKQEAVEPTCTETGKKTYYTCTCGKWFFDSACTDEIEDHAEIIVPAIDHDESGQYEADETEHWKICGRCHKEIRKAAHEYDNDADTTCNICGYERTIEHIHSVTEAVPAKAADCTDDGNTAYYICSCGKWFSDSSCTVEITDKTKVTIQKLGHDYSVVEKDGTGHWKKCIRCEETQPKEEHIYDNGDDRDCNVCGYVRTPGSDPGLVSKEVETGENAPDTQLAASAKELADMILTDAEKQQVESGTDIRFILDVKDAADTISSEDKAAVQAALDGYTQGQYLDISLLKIIGQTRTAISETTGKITIVIDVPDSLKNTDSRTARTYAVIRVHNGTAQRLDDLDDNDSTITIATDRFSTYALVYQDTGESQTAVTGVILDKDKAVLAKAGETVQLTATVLPADAANKKVTWASSDTNVASVDENGKITAVGDGTCTITVTTEDGNKTAVCQITVGTGATDIPSTPTPTPGATDTPSTPTPAPGEDGTKTKKPTAKEKRMIELHSGLKAVQTGGKLSISWGRVSGADGYSVYVQYCGKNFTAKSLHSVKSGKVKKITVKKVNGKKLDTTKNFKVYVVAYKLVGKKKTSLAKTITVHVAGQNSKKYTNVKTVKVKQTSYTLKKGESVKVKPKAVVYDKRKKQLSTDHTAEFRYMSSNKKVATVSSAGKVKAKGPGECIIYVYARNGTKRKIKVKVK